MASPHQMDAERWRRISELYHEAAAHEEKKRAAFLADACAGDEALRQEVQSLLDSRAAGDGLLAGPALAVAARMVSDPAASALTGRRIGVYQLQERIGAGGMGEVYRARDTRLGRDVAVKILPRAFTADRDRLARFEREARLLASLNHPNIATIHGIEDSDGIRALVMELIEGPTLAERLAQGAMPVSEALAVARQIADALDVAHEKGIVHRDLKPANIKVTSSGAVKVLDFGLAKAVGADRAGEDLSQLPTMTGEGTREGAVVGTPAYMSPEQTRGQSVDKRTDIWAFGCVLYEMLTGRAAFARATISDTIATILDRDPDWQAVPSGSSPALNRLLRHCLVKEPRRRLRDIGDARMEIDEILAAGSEMSAPSEAGTARRRPWVWASVGFVLAGLIAAGIALSSMGGRSSSERPSQFTLSFAGQMADVAATTTPVPSPDGRYFVFVGTNKDGSNSLWIRPIDSAEARPLPGTEGSQPQPFWSADARWIGFYADGKIKKVGVSGGQPQTIATLPGFQDGAWGSNGDIIFRRSNREGLSRVSESDDRPRPLTQLNRALSENSHRGPTFLPDGRRFLFTSRCATPENNALYIGSLDSPEVRRVMSIESKAVYIPSRNGSPAALLYYRDGGLEARALDADSGKLIGDPQAVIAGVDYNAAGIQAFFQVSADGRVIVMRPAGAGDTQLTWFERNGEQTGTLGSPGESLQPRISPKGERVAFTRPDPQSGNRDVWTVEVARGISSRLTLDPANDWHAVWSPDGKRMAFNSDRGGGSAGRLYVKQSMDSGAEESSLFDISGGPTDWSRDGQWIALGGNTLEIGAVSGNRGRPFPFLVTTFFHGGARFSPDGKWLAYTSNETGRFEVFVRPFAGTPAAAEGKIQISDNGGDHPVWRSDGQELYYMSGDFNIYAVATSDPLLKSAVPRPQQLFRACPETVPLGQPMRGTPWTHPFDTLDGNRFLINCLADPPGQFVVLMNWSLAADR